MSRYFIEVAYLGTRYAGFQIQENANTIQAEVEKCLGIFFKSKFGLTGSSRTDAGVHAKQNFFHTDSEIDLTSTNSIYHLNAILPFDIVIKNIFAVKHTAHCRFDARSREYRYHIYHEKDPFTGSTAWFYPYPLDKNALDAAAAEIIKYFDFTSFSKRNTQVHHFLCTMLKSEWEQRDGQLVYQVRANRFLRGMVRGLVATMLQVGRGKISQQEFIDIIDGKDCTRADFSAPAHGLFLEKVEF
jgi:tRNA pseudouridine38-40 synthase